jgi:hypothetical protein
MNLRPALVFFVLALTACAGTSKVMLGQARAPVDPAVVRIYTTPPPGSVEIAQLESSSAVGFGTQGQTDAAVARLKREAAALGANGVILMGVGSSGSPVGMSVGAGSYFYGYTRIMELRLQTELALGKRFDRKAFNNFLLDQGLLPPDQLARAVTEQFIPAQSKKKG